MISIIIYFMVCFRAFPKYTIIPAKWKLLNFYVAVRLFGWPDNDDPWLNKVHFSGSLPLVPLLSILQSSPPGKLYILNVKITDPQSTAIHLGHRFWHFHYCDVIMGSVASQITSLTIVYSPVYSDADQSKHQSSASLAFVWGIHRGPMNSPHKGPVTRKMLLFDDVIMLAIGGLN